MNRSHHSQYAVLIVDDEEQILEIYGFGSHAVEYMQTYHHLMCFTGREIIE